MKPRCSKQRNHALTLMETVIVILVIGFLAAMILPAFRAGDGRIKKISCSNNLKQIGLAERIWAGDHNDKFPFQVSVTNGGTMELNNGRNGWINFLVMKYELSTPKVLICPDDAKRESAATNFSTGLVGHISYFVGLNASDDNPQNILSGDDNFEIADHPAKPGLLEISSNTPVAWSAARHHFSGYIVFADSSVRQVNSRVGDVKTNDLQTLFQQTGLATNRLAIP